MPVFIKYVGSDRTGTALRKNPLAPTEDVAWGVPFEMQEAQADEYLKTYPNSFARAKDESDTSDYDEMYPSVEEQERREEARRVALNKPAKGIIENNKTAKTTEQLNAESAKAAKKNEIPEGVKENNSTAVDFEEKNKQAIKDNKDQDLPEGVDKNNETARDTEEINKNRREEHKQMVKANKLDDVMSDKKGNKRGNKKPVIDDSINDTPKAE